MLALSPNALKEAIAVAYATKTPIFVWGVPGIGKSAIIRQLASSQARTLLDLRASQLDAVDVRGVPYVQGGVTYWARPAFLPDPESEMPVDLFLDELNRAPAAVQNALLELVLDRRVGSYVLPACVNIVAAGNLEEHGGGVTRLSPALANRFEHVWLQPDLEDWCQWAYGAGVHPAIIAFLRGRPELLVQYSGVAKAFATPRTWEYASRILQYGASGGVEHALLCGTIGEGPAVELSAYLLLYRSLPSVDAILLNPGAALVPAAPDALYAIAAALAHRATEGGIGRVIEYLERLPEEYNVFCMQMALGRTPGISVSPAFVEWSVAHADVMLGRRA